MCTLGLNLAPAGNVDVSVTRGSGAIIVNKTGGTAGAFQSLRFTTSSWGAQAITVAALEDANAISGDVTITHAVVNASSSSGFDPASDKNLTATVTGDDAGLSVSPQAVTVAEGSVHGGPESPAERAGDGDAHCGDGKRQTLHLCGAGDGARLGDDRRQDAGGGGST